MSSPNSSSTSGGPGGRIPSTTRLLSPEEIAVKAGEQVPFLQFPVRSEVFAQRALRLRERAAGHSMRDYLMFVAELVEAQHRVLSDHPDVPLPSEEAIDEAAASGRPLLDVSTWKRDPSWRDGLARLLDTLQPRIAGQPAEAVLQRLRALPAETVEAQADRLLHGLQRGLDVATAPFIGAALQVHFTHLVLATEARHGQDRLTPFGRTDDATLCPCCGSRPTASVTQVGGDSAGYRYLHCAVCSSRWHMVRIKCSHCEGTKGIHLQSLQAADAPAQPATPQAFEAIQAEACDSCGHYLKIVHMSRDLNVEPVADDLASLTLDLLVHESGLQRHGHNLLLVFGEPEEDEASSASPTASAA